MQMQKHFIYLVGRRQSDGFDPLDSVSVEVESVLVRQPPDQLHDCLTAHFGHPVEEDDLLVRPRCVVQLLNVQLEILHRQIINLIRF